MKLLTLSFKIIIVSLFSISWINPASRPEADDLWINKTETYLPLTSEWTNRVEVADLNGDDMPDLLFANGGNYSEPGTLESSRIFINKGAEAKFEETTAQIFGLDKYYARVIKVRDLDNDRLPEIIIGTTFQTQSQIYKGTSKGVFKNATSTGFPVINSSVGDLEFGDVDADGDLDIILADWGPGINMENSGGRTMLWVNDGKANFKNVTVSQMPESLIQFSWDLEFVDFDNDFDLDIVVSCKRCGGGKLFVNDGKGFFKERFGIPSYTNNYEFETMDVNLDGFPDLVTVNDGEIVDQQFYSRREHIFLNDSGKFFRDATETLWPPSENIGEDDNNVVFLDYDSDHDPDFLLSSLTGEDRLLINDGKGKFKLAQPVLKGNDTPHTLSLVVADINNDKKLDIVMGQGEGKKEIDERIFLGNKILPDTAAPAIPLYKVFNDPVKQTITVSARIHDNKSPDMPQDWQSVELITGEKSKPISMMWYGENLWRVQLPGTAKTDKLKICATDHSGNKKCVFLKQ